jgi:hypothetical protein
LFCSFSRRFHTSIAAVVSGTWWLVLVGAVAAINCVPVSADGDHERFFESQIRPLLAEHCLECHGTTEQSGDLRLDSRVDLLKGGQSGPVVIPGKPNESRLIHAVRRTDDLAMPPENELTPAQVQVLEHWVKLGAPWPEFSGPIVDPRDAAAREHWAFQPLQIVEPPQVDAEWIQNPVDAFILHRLQQHEFSPSPAANRRTLLRRAGISLTGLPPSMSEVDAFERNSDPDAWSQEVERLLASSSYGEQWARHWLDIARYSDTKGYVYAREQRKWVHAWSYRDWVIEALNNDMPYDRFLLLQLAADQVPDRQPDDLAAMGFLTVGRRFLGVTRDVMDDRIDTITRGTMGLTVACARCHDHKYDPIPTTDYYALYGVLNSCVERRVKLPGETGPTEEWSQELEVRTKAFDDRYVKERQISAERCRAMLDRYLRVQTSMETVPAQGFDQILLESDVLPGIARRWEEYLRAARRNNDPVFRHWHAYASIAPDDFAAHAGDVSASLRREEPGCVNRQVANMFEQPPSSFDEVVDRYIAIFTSVRDRWEESLRLAEASGGEVPETMGEPELEQLRLVLYGPDSPCVVPDVSLVHTEYLFTTDTCRQLWELQKKVDEWLQTAPHQPRYALTLADRSTPLEPRVFRRGNPKTPGEEVPRGFLSVLSDDETREFEHGSGRFELAQAIVDARNPLTARVMVNRVWAWHFGRGLVPTPSDFGVRAGQPSHPRLLDWLARTFIEHDWSLKYLHRLILSSATWQQSSGEPLAPDVRERVQQHDPSNRLLWRMPLHRLTFEEFRDSILAVSGELHDRQGGRPESLFGDSATKRRTVYGEIDRQFFPTALRVFDMANPDIHVPQRSETTVPQQALFYLNHPLVQDRARELARLAAEVSSNDERVAWLFRTILQRTPDAREVEDAVALVTGADVVLPEENSRRTDWSYLVGNLDPKTGSLSNVEPIPYFTGTAWQGGDKWPDAALGWIQLTATGGHPGNDHQHVCIRRWKAPRSMTVTVESALVHDAEPGDGIRALVINSKQSVLSEQRIHQQSVAMNCELFRVQKDETIDFVVDIGEGLNSDQFLWNITVREQGGDATVWNSEADFGGPAANPLTPWEQLAQVLLCSNEFLFVD